MKKLQLDLSDLRVESFQSSEQAEPRGTVQGHASSPYVTCYYTDCGNPGTCAANMTCDGAIGRCDPYSGAVCETGPDDC
jgi:hypothetical protein